MNLSAEVFDNSSSDVEVDCIPSTPIQGATPVPPITVTSVNNVNTMSDNMPTHVRTLFTSSTNPMPVQSIVSSALSTHNTPTYAFSFFTPSTASQMSQRVSLVPVTATQQTFATSTSTSGVQQALASTSSQPQHSANIASTTLANSFQGSIQPGNQASPIKVGSSASLVALLQASRKSVAEYQPTQSNLPTAQPTAPPPRATVYHVTVPRPGGAAPQAVPRLILHRGPAPQPRCNLAPITQVSIPQVPPPSLNVTAPVQPGMPQPIPAANQDASVSKQEINAMFLSFADFMKGELRAELSAFKPAQPLTSCPTDDRPRSPTMPVPTTPSPVRHSNSERSSPVLVPQGGQSQLPPTHSVDTDRRQEGASKVTNQEAPLPAPKGPMGATPIKRHAHKSRKRSRHDDSSPSPSDSDSGSDYDRRHNKKSKSGAFRTYSNRVKMTFRWPNEYIGREDGYSPTYDQLTYSELVCGIFRGLARQLPKSSSTFSVEQQLHYYAEMFYEAPISNFQNAKMAHRMVLEALEKKDLTSDKWEDWDIKRQQVISRLHRSASTTSKPNNNNNNGNGNKSKPKPPKVLRVTPCEYWNAGTCQIKAEEHPGARVMWTHICASCFLKGEKVKHRDRDPTCPNKELLNTAPKNHKGPAKGQQ